MLLVLAGCASNNPFDGGSGDRVDNDLTGAIAASGGDDDSGTTTTTTTDTTDTTAPTTTDTTGCGPGDLDFTLEARASDDLAYDAFYYGETIDLVAVFDNGCADSIVVSAPEDCIADGWRVEGDDGTDSSDAVDCGSGQTTIAGGGWVENRYELGDGLGVGSYTATASSEALDGSASVSFTVQ